MEYGIQNIQDCLGFPFKGQSLATANVTSKKQEFAYDALLTKQTWGQDGWILVKYEANIQPFWENKLCQ